jgi:cell division septation protein DedD
MGIRNILILFFSAMAVSVVILTVFFSLFFKNFDNLVTFDTRLPESAPEFQSASDETGPQQDSRAQGVRHSTINVPKDSRPAPASSDTHTTPEVPSVGIGADLFSDDFQDDEMFDGLDMPTTTKPATTSGDSKPVSATPNSTSDGKKPPASPAVDRAEPSTPPPPPPPPSLAEPTGDASPPSGRHQVYLDGFGSVDDARKTVEHLKAQGVQALVKQNGNKTIIQLGTFNNEAYARSLAEQIGGKIKSLP